MTQENEEKTTKHTKVNFATTEIEALSSDEHLHDELNEFEMVPKTFSTLGIPGQTGLAVVFNGSIVSAIKHPKLTPKSFDFETGKAEFWGQQNMEQMDSSMALPLGPEYTMARAKELLSRIENEGLTHVSESTGFARVGVEEEHHQFTADGEPFAIDSSEQIEVQENVREIALSPTNSILEQANEIARSRLKEAGRRPENIINSTSFNILSRPDGLTMNSGDFAPYVRAVTTYMVENYFEPKDPIVKEYWNNIAQNSGYEDFHDLKATVNDLSPLAFCAAHASLGLRSEKINESYHIGLEEGIAVADMINSDFGTLLEWMTYSTPLVFGNKEGVEIDGEIRYPKDARAVARLASKTTYPGEFILTTKNYKDRVVNAMINGSADRIDRAAYVYYDEDLDEEVASAHGRVRLRVTGGSGREKFVNPLGRVEFTGGPETPDLEALLARNAMLKLMGIASYDALANGQHPVEHFKENFPSMSTCDEHIGLAHAYNFYGANHPKASALIAEGRAFLDYMDKRFSDKEVLYLIDLANRGLDKLAESTEARNLEDYLENPKGNISDVISNMWEDGYSALEISKAISDYEKEQAVRLLAFEGDILEMNKGGRS